MYDEIRAQSHAIDTRGLETGGGLFGPPIRGWHEQAHVAIANVAVALRRRGKVELAYGQLEAKEAAMIRFQDSPLRRLGDWHVHPTCPAGTSGNRQSPTCRRGWTSLTAPSPRATDWVRSAWTGPGGRVGWCFRPSELGARRVVRGCGGLAA